MRGIFPRAFGFAMLAASAPALGQLLPAQQPAKRVEQGLGDLGPTTMSLRDLQLDLRAPTGFESVYEVDRANPYGAPGERSTPMFMRMSGGVAAVFPRSVYLQGKGGLLPQIPPDTVFYIGGLPKTFSTGAHKAALPRAGNWMDLSVNTAVREEGADEAGTPPAPSVEHALTPQPSMFDDEEFRKYRVARLLDAARPRYPTPFHAFAVARIAIAPAILAAS